MKKITIYMAGCLLMAVVATLILSGHPAYTVAGVLLAFGIYKSGSTKSGRKFWRTWHRVNLHIVKTYSE